MKEIKTSKGIIKYKQPNTPEAMRLMGRIKKKVETNASAEEYISATIEEMGFLFDTTDMKLEYKELFEIEEAAELLIEISGEFLGKMGALLKKKGA